MRDQKPRSLAIQTSLITARSPRASDRCHSNKVFLYNVPSLEGRQGDGQFLCQHLQDPWLSVEVQQNYSLHP